MVNPFSILWRSVVAVYDDLFPMVGTNLLWLLLSVPVVVVTTAILSLLGVPNEIGFGLALVFAIIAPSPASVGIHLFMNRKAKDERVEFGLFWEGLRTYWRRSLALLVIALLGAAILAVNLRFYFINGPSILRYIAILWFYVLVLWFMMLMYMNPLLVEQDNKSLKLIVRNAFVLSLDNLIPSLVLLVVLVILSAVSIAITLLVALLTASFVAAVETHAVLAYLDKYRAREANQSSRSG